MFRTGMSHFLIIYVHLASTGSLFPARLMQLHCPKEAKNSKSSKLHTTKHLQYCFHFKPGKIQELLRKPENSPALGLQGLPLPHFFAQVPVPSRSLRTPRGQGLDRAWGWGRCRPPRDGNTNKQSPNSEFWRFERFKFYRYPEKVHPWVYKNFK